MIAPRRPAATRAAGRRAVGWVSLLAGVVATAGLLRGSGRAGSQVAPEASGTRTGPWRIAVGDRLVYRLSYASDSYADLKVLYEGIAPASATEPAAAPLRFRVAVETGLVITAVRRTEPSTVVAVRFPDARVDASGSEAGAPLTALLLDPRRIREELDRPVFCEVDSAGRIRSVLFDAGQEGAAQNLVRSLLGLVQFAQPEGAGGHEWEVREDDPSGEYRARYREVAAASRAGAGSAARTFEKARLEYLPADPESDLDPPVLPRTIRPDGFLTASFDFGEGRLVSLKGEDVQTVVAAGRVVGGARNAVDLNWVRSERATASDVARSTEEHATRQRIGTATALSFAPSEHAQVTAIHRAQLGDDTLDTVRASLGDADDGSRERSARLHAKLKALVFLRPETARPLGRWLPSLPQPAARLVRGALSSVGTPEAQVALVAALRPCPRDEDAGLQLIVALGRVKKPTQETEDALAEIAWGSATPAGRAAQLQLGAVARQLRRCCPERAARIVATAIGRLSVQPGSDRQLIALLGNSGAAAALPILEPYLRGSRPDLRGPAALALRFVEGPRAEELLAGTLSTDRDETVRAHAADAFEFRSMTPVGFEAQKRALRSDASAAVRVRVMRNLWRSRGVAPEVLDLIKGVASADPSPELRRVAAQALAGVETGGTLPRASQRKDPS